MSSEKAQIIDQIKKIDDIFSHESKNKRNKKFSIIQVQRSKNCHLHSPHHSSYTDKQTKLRNRNSIGSIRELLPHQHTHYPSNTKLNVSTASPNAVTNVRRDSVASTRAEKPKVDSEKLFKGIEHPSAFPSFLRSSTTSLVSRKDSENYQRKKHSDYFDSRSLFATDSALTSSSKRHSIHNINIAPGAFSTLPSSKSAVRDHHVAAPISILKKEPSPKPFNNNNNYYGSERKLNRDDDAFDVSMLKTFDKLNHRRLSFGRDSVDSVDWGRRISIDSLDSRRSSYSIIEKLDKPEPESNEGNRPRFIKVTTLEDVQAVRCAEFHPNGQLYAVGSNSKTFRICEYPSLADIREENVIGQPTVLFKRTKHHKGSIYCMAWSPQGDLIATGSNDKTVKLMRFNEDQKQLEGQEVELTMHDGTIRDLCFLEDISNKSSLLISGGAGDCKIYVTDCETSTPFQALSGHGGHILSLYNWGGVMFVSGSQDKTVRFWDLRTRGCTAIVKGRQDSPVTATCVDPSGRLLVSGHEDSSCVLFDIRGNRPIQSFKPHAGDVRSIRFSPSAYYLLTGGYDNKLVLTDLQGDLTMPLPSVVVAEHTDKVISGRWHPTDFSFLSTAADKTAVLWALPPI